MISESCESHMKVDVEVLMWKDYLYFNLIYATVHSVCHLSRFH